MAMWPCHWGGSLRSQPLLSLIFLALKKFFTGVKEAQSGAKLIYAHQHAALGAGAELKGSIAPSASSTRTRKDCVEQHELGAYLACHSVHDPLFKVCYPKGNFPKANI